MLYCSVYPNYSIITDCDGEKEREERKLNEEWTRSWASKLVQVDTQNSAHKSKRDKDILLYTAFKGNSASFDIWDLHNVHINKKKFSLSMAKGFLYFSCYFLNVVSFSIHKENIGSDLRQFDWGIRGLCQFMHFDRLSISHINIYLQFPCKFNFTSVMCPPTWFSLGYGSIFPINFSH